MFIHYDQLNRGIALAGPPKRIVSLVPSQTELLNYLGLEEEVVGITKFCIYPEHWYRNKTRVGGTKSINLGIVASLQPDLIIANKEENVKEQIAELEKIAPVWISDVGNADTAFSMMQSIGEITAKKREAEILINAIQTHFTELTLLTKQNKKNRAAYLIWKDPYMTAGGDTFIHDMLRLCGLENVCKEMTRYPTVTLEELRLKNTELVLLSTEPYPFNQKHLDELTHQLPGTKVLLVDGEIFSWYGSRMLKVLPYVKKMLKEVRS